MTLQEKKSNCFSIWWNRCWLFFFFFLIVSIVQNRVIRLSKGLLRETYSIKEFTFKPKLSIKALNWRLNYTWQGKNTLYILKYWMIFCILSKKLKQISHIVKKIETILAYCRKNWNTSCNLLKKINTFRILSKKNKRYSHPVKKIENCYAFCRKKN